MEMYQLSITVEDGDVVLRQDNTIGEEASWIHLHPEQCALVCEWLTHLAASIPPKDAEP